MKNVVIPLVTAAAVFVAMIFLASTPETRVCEAPDITLPELAGFTSEAMEPSEAELTVLPADTRQVKRMYHAESGHWYSVSVVIGGRTKNSIHRPELCLPSQGFLMTRPRTRQVGPRSWRLITLDGGAERPSLGFAYTFFNQEGFRTSSHVRRILKDVWDRSFFNRIDRWVMVTVNSSRSDDRGMTDFLAKLEGSLR